MKKVNSDGSITNNGFSMIKYKKSKCKKWIANEYDRVEDGHSCLRHYTCRSCGHVHLRKGYNSTEK